MNYLQICDYDDSTAVKASAFQDLAQVLHRYAEVFERWDLLPHGTQYVRGQSRVHLEYDTLYYRVDEPHLGAYLAGMDVFRGRWRRPELVRIFEAA